MASRGKETKCVCYFVSYCFLAICKQCRTRLRDHQKPEEAALGISELDNVSEVEVHKSDTTTPAFRSEKSVLVS